MQIDIAAGIISWIIEKAISDIIWCSRIFASEVKGRSILNMATIQIKSILYKAVDPPVYQVNIVDPWIIDR